MIWVFLSWITVIIFLYDDLKFILSYKFAYWYTNVYSNELLYSDIDTSWITYFILVPFEINDDDEDDVELIILVISTKILSYFNNDSTFVVVTVYWPKILLVISVTKLLFPFGLLGSVGTNSYGTVGCSVIRAINGSGLPAGILYPIALYLFLASVFL